MGTFMLFGFYIAFLFFDTKGEYSTDTFPIVLMLFAIGVILSEIRLEIKKGK